MKQQQGLGDFKFHKHLFVTYYVQRIAISAVRAAYKVTRHGSSRDLSSLGKNAQSQPVDNMALEWEHSIQGGLGCLVKKVMAWEGPKSMNWSMG
jgi:hypothetical protein